MWHLLGHHRGVSATSQAAWDGPSQRQNPGAKPTSSFVWLRMKIPFFSTLNSVPPSSLLFSTLQLLILLLMARLAKRSHSRLLWSHSNREKVSKWDVLLSGPGTPSPPHWLPISCTHRVSIKHSIALNPWSTKSFLNFHLQHGIIGTKRNMQQHPHAESLLRSPQLPGVRLCWHAWAMERPARNIGNSPVGGLC